MYFISSLCKTTFFLRQLPSYKPLRMPKARLQPSWYAPQSIYDKNEYERTTHLHTSASYIGETYLAGSQGEGYLLRNEARLTMKELIYSVDTYKLIRPRTAVQSTSSHHTLETHSPKKTRVGPQKQGPSDAPLPSGTNKATAGHGMATWGPSPSVRLRSESAGTTHT